MVNFTTRIPDCDSHSPALLDLFISSDTNICSTMAFPPLAIRDHLRDVPWEDIFKLSASTAASEFYECVQVGLDVYIPYRKYQVKPHSSPWFSAACAVVIAHRNHFFRLYQQNKSSESKVKFRQASNRCKSVLEGAKHAYAAKTKESITSQKIASPDVCRIANSVLNKGKSAIPLLFNGPELLSSA